MSFFKTKDIYVLNRVAVSSYIQLRSIERRVLVNLLTHKSTFTGYGYAPTIRQIAREIGTSKGRISSTLKSLREKEILEISNYRTLGAGRKTPIHTLHSSLLEHVKEWTKETSQSFPYEKKSSSQGELEVTKGSNREINNKDNTKSESFIFSELVNFLETSQLKGGQDE